MKKSLDKIKFDLSGPNWQMEGIRPGEGEKVGFHELPPDITGDAFNWTFANVPGDVYTDLWRSGRIDDPHFGRNSLKAKWVTELEWWYKRQFDVPQEMKGKRIRLVFEGVDYACDVWFNGHLLGTHEGMLSSFQFDVTDHVNFETLRFGTNVLMVRLHPAPRRYSQVAGRKPAWHGDYWVSLTPTGIWRPVYLEAMGDVTIQDTWIKSAIQKDGTADLDVQIELDNPTDKSRNVNVQVDVSGKNFSSQTYSHFVSFVAEPGITTGNVPVKVDKAKLWFPWDLGEQNLYIAHVKVAEENGEFQDEKNTTFGIREIEMEMNPGFMPEQVENPWTVMINGKRHFMRSGTWGGPPDIFFGRATEDKYRELIRLAKEANLNNLRIFGWHPEEISLFYDLCNEAGITVWQDIVPLASLSLPEDEEFKKAVFDEAIHILKKQRNHPSLVLIEGSEELFMTAINRQHNLNFVTELGEALKPYSDLYYLPSSPLSDEVGLELGFKPNESYHANDLFYGEGQFIMETYFPSLDFAVIPELAISSCPNVESIKKFIPAEELWPPGPSWGHHWADFDVFRTLNYEVLGDECTHSLQAFVEATQMAQGTIFQFALEHFRRRKPRTSAVCICHYITFAPDMKWGIVDYYQDKKQSFDYVQRAYQPLLVSLQYEKRRWLPGSTFTATLWVVNDFYKDFLDCTATVCIFDKDRRKIHEVLLKVEKVTVDSSQSYADISCSVPGQMGDRFYTELLLQDKHGKTLSANEYMLLVADQDAEVKRIRQIGREAIEVKQVYGWANYYRYFKELDKADEKMPIAAGFENSTNQTKNGAAHE